MKLNKYTRRAIALWMLTAIFLAIFLFGEAVRVDFLEPAVSLSKALESARWRWGFSDEHRQTLWMLFSCLIAYSVSNSAKVRLGAMAFGILTPVLMTGPVMFAIAGISPLIVFSALTGQLDGESYCEGMVPVSALGLWMLCGVIFGVLEALEIRRAWKTAGVGNPVDSAPGKCALMGRD